MKLLKYVMTSDCGLAPNPYFGICSLALCTPNHMNARLEVGDWIVGHSSRQHGRRLIHAMRVTRVLDMPTYFAEFPQKRPNPLGSREEQRGDNMYNLENGHWVRLPSAFHNNTRAFRKDLRKGQGAPVFLAEGPDNFWFFGGSNHVKSVAFSDEFPGLIKDRQGVSYVDDEELIRKFADWLRSGGRSGLIGEPRDDSLPLPEEYLVALEPEEQWIESGCAGKNVGHPGGAQRDCGYRRKSEKTTVRPMKRC